MLAKKQFIIGLLVFVQASVWAFPKNTQAPKTETIGKVTATEQAGQYTYVEVEIDGGKTWFAAPATTFIIGEEVVSPAGGLPMKDFYSKTLDRTFETVYFVGSVKRVNAPEEETLPPGHPPIHETETPKPSEIDLTGIERAEGGKTVAEIYQQKSKLADQPVIVRGKAVKVANGILGKNWIHLRDGSGEAGSNDLTITTSADVEVGATITASGTLRLDRDFGAGYKYGVLLEDADVQAR